MTDRDAALEAAQTERQRLLAQVNPEAKAKVDRPACDQVLSLALVRITGATHYGCGAPMSAHWGKDCRGTKYPPGSPR